MSMDSDAGPSDVHSLAKNNAMTPEDNSSDGMVERHQEYSLITF